MIRETHPAAVALAIDGNQIQADLLGRTRIRRRALQHADRRSARLDARHRRIGLGQRAHAGREQHRRTGVEHAIEQLRIRDFTRGDLPQRLPDALQQIDRGQRERRRDEEDVALGAVRGQPAPLLLGELHPLPVVVARGVLPAELHAERFGRRALRCSDVRLELHRVGAGRGNGVDERVRQAETAVVRHRHFANHQASAGAEPGQRRMHVRHECRINSFFGFQ